MCSYHAINVFPQGLLGCRLLVSSACGLHLPSSCYGEASIALSTASSLLLYWNSDEMGDDFGNLGTSGAV
mgnify:FL=1